MEVHGYVCVGKRADLSMWVSLAKCEDRGAAKMWLCALIADLSVFLYNGIAIVMARSDSGL